MTQVLSEFRVHRQKAGFGKNYLQKNGEKLIFVAQSCCFNFVSCLPFAQFVRFFFISHHPSYGESESSFFHLNRKEETTYLVIWLFIFCVPLALK